MDFARPSIDNPATTSSDESTEKSVDTARQTSIDDTSPEAGPTPIGPPLNYQKMIPRNLGLASNTYSCELMRKFDALSEHIKRVDGQVAENATTIKREAGRLHGRTDANPKRQVNAVLLRSRKCLIPSTIEINNAEKHAVVEETGENRSRPIILNAPNTDLETPREKELSNTEEAAIALEEEEERLEEDVEIDRQERINVDRHTTVNAVLLRSGKHLIPSTIEINNAEKHAVVEETGENRSRPIILDAPNTDLETPREKELPNTEEAAIDLEEEEEGLEEDVEIDRQERINVDRHTTVNIDRQCGNNVDRRSTLAEPTMERVYRTLPPFPPNKTQTKRELDKAISRNHSTRSCWRCH
ncbi:hypothetical protein F2Q70_00012035 [Brassica cretica]|uniref:Uncharacterized protein n=1 Tax=Brassica cretica TaxID=69181 RepID=A0A8S9LWD8_BRACR|nr:hypothetical protein F2Q70_00012035 [Brassica cretica]